MSTDRIGPAGVSCTRCWTAWTGLRDAECDRVCAACGGRTMTSSPRWLHERNNDPYGTPGRHPFWETVSFEVIGAWRIFERDGSWWAFKPAQNAWSTARPSRDDAVAMATGRQTDIWA